MTTALSATRCVGRGPLQGRPDATRARERSYQEGRLAGLAEGAAKLGWDKLATSPGFHRFMDHIHQEEK